MQHGGSNDYCALITCLAMLAPFWVTARGSRGPSHVLMPAADYRLRARMPYPIRDYAVCHVRSAAPLYIQRKGQSH